MRVIHDDWYRVVSTRRERTAFYKGIVRTSMPDKHQTHDVFRPSNIKHTSPPWAHSILLTGITLSDPPLAVHKVDHVAEPVECHFSECLCESICGLGGCWGPLEIDTSLTKKR